MFHRKILTKLAGKGGFILRNNFFVFPLLILTLILSGCLSGPLPPSAGKSYSVIGSVQDSLSGLPLWSGTVTIGEASAQIKEGRFQIENVAPGAHTLKISKPFYKTLEKRVIISNSNITLTDLKLKPDFTDDELGLFARLVSAEAKGEPYEGQVAVAATVLNRLLHAEYPNTLREVVYQVTVDNGIKYYQYEPVLNGTIDNPATDDAKLAVFDALAGWDPSLGATGFFAPALVPPTSKWVWSRPVTTNIGGHRFFK